MTRTMRRWLFTSRFILSIFFYIRRKKIVWTEFFTLFFHCCVPLLLTAIFTAFVQLLTDQVLDSYHHYESLEGGVSHDFFNFSPHQNMSDTSPSVQQQGAPLTVSSAPESTPSSSVSSAPEPITSGSTTPDINWSECYEGSYDHVDSFPPARELTPEEVEAAALDDALWAKVDSSWTELVEAYEACDKLYEKYVEKYNIWVRAADAYADATDRVEALAYKEYEDHYDDVAAQKKAFAACERARFAAEYALDAHDKHHNEVYLKCLDAYEKAEDVYYNGPAEEKSPTVGHFDLALAYLTLSSVATLLVIIMV